MARRRLVAAGALGAAVVTAGVVVVASGGGGEHAAAASASQATATTLIKRQDLVESDSVDGTLGYSDARAVINRLPGTVTWTPAVGSTVRTDHRLYEVDGAAVYLLDGSYPAYRTLKAGLKGDDVRALERNLRVLGLDPKGKMDVDGRWDAGTTEAVKRWQRRKGMEADGSIEQGRIVFQPGARRVGSIQIVAGASASPGGSQTAPTAATGSAASTRFAVLETSERGAGWSDIGGDVGLPQTTVVQDGAAPTGATGASGATGATGTTGGSGGGSSPPATGTTQPGTARPGAARPGTTTQPGATTQSGTTGKPGAAAQPGATRPGAAQPSTAGAAPGTGGAGAGAGAAAQAATGSAAAEVASALMTTTSTKRIVSVDLKTSDVELAKVGAGVEVELPGGERVDGTIARVGKVAKQAASQDPNTEEPVTVKVIVKLRRSGGSGLDQAPVDVRLEQRRAKDVLTIPVTALLARQGGTFAVEVRQGTNRRIVPVRTGLFTSGLVEIEGAGLAPGMRVTDAEV